MKTKPESTTVTVRFTLEVDREMTLTQHDKHPLLTNVEWAKEQIEMRAQEIEMGVDGRVDCQWRIIEGDLPAEICEDDEDEEQETPDKAPTQ